MRAVVISNIVYESTGFGCEPCCDPGCAANGSRPDANVLSVNGDGL